MSLTWGRQRITGASLVNAQYDLTLERQTTMDNILFIPGIANPVSEINQLLFGQGQQGTFIAPSLTASLISGSTFGTGVQTLPDLSPRNNPFSQATPASRGAWFREPKRGRVNLFEQTENFGNAYWTKTRVTASGQIITETADTGTHEIVRSLQSAGTIGVRYTMSCIISLTERTTVRMFFTGSAFGAQRGADFNLTTNEVTLFGVAGNLEASMAALADGKHFIRVSVDTGSTNTGVSPTIQFTDGVGVTSFAGSLTSSALIEKYQVELGSTSTAYQRVTTAFDVTEAGQRDCYGVRGDGIDDGYVTSPIPFGSANAVTIFAAYRALAGTPRARITGYTVDASNFNQLEAPGFNDNRFEFGMRLGSTGSSPSFVYTAPTTRIITAVGSRFLQQLRIDGVLQSENTIDFGTNTIGTVPLDLFFRSSASDRFANGSLFALIYVAGTYPLSTIQRVERILSRITPTVNL